jgi:hypothetical protein
MSSGFNVVYVGGGVIDKIRELPYPHFSKFTKPYIKGRKMQILEEARSFIDTFTLPFPTEFLSVAFSASQYCDDDYWELTIGVEKICEQIWTKDGLPESVSMGNSFGIVYPLPANTPIKFEFSNGSGTAKMVKYNIKFLRK